MLYVQLPTTEERLDILKTLCSKVPLDAGVDLGLVAAHPNCSRFSGADLASLIREAGLVCLQEGLQSGATDDLKITLSHFETAFTKIPPSVSMKVCNVIAELFHSLLLYMGIGFRCV